MYIDSSKTALLFPGQGSQKIGMGIELADCYPEAKTTFLESDHCVGFSLSNLAWQGQVDELNDTVNTQPALLTHSYAALRVLRSYLPGFMPSFVAGHSMGEISALVASDSFSFFDGLKLGVSAGS